MTPNWVICEPMKEDTEDCGHRWIAFPASEETKEGKMTNGIFRI